jgi:signal transduction histidine kinase
MNDENLSEAFRAGLKGGLKIVKGRWIFTPIAWFKRQQQIIEAEVKKQTEELQDEQAKLYSSINSLPIGFLIADASDRIIAINPIAKNMIWNTATPTSAAEIGKNLGPEVQNAYVQSKHTQKPIEIKHFTFGAKFLHLFFVPIFVLGERGRYIGTVMLAEDITEATVLERSKDEFFSIASHELRTPLTAIRGNTSMLMDYFVADLKDDNVKGMIGDIHESSIRLIGIVNDFLDLSRLEQKRMEFKKEDLDIVGLSNEVIGELQANVQSGVVLQVTGGENIPHVVADKNKTKEVLINLVGNSLKFTESGSVSIQFEKREHLLAVKIVDTGRGIPEANQSLLFRKFQQAGSSLYTRDTTKGTGLGLYISKLLVEGMGGSVQLVSSEQGKGSVFEFTLPLT